MMRLTDLPPQVLRPQSWPMWVVIAYTGKTGNIHLGKTFVRADSESRACELGKSALRLIGVRGRFVVNAKPYYPWLDGALNGYVGYSKEGA